MWLFVKYFVKKKVMSPCAAFQPRTQCYILALEFLKQHGILEITWNSFDFSKKQNPPQNPHFVFFNYSDNVFIMGKKFKRQAKREESHGITRR